MGGRLRYVLVAAAVILAAACGPQLRAPAPEAPSGPSSTTPQATTTTLPATTTSTTIPPCAADAAAWPLADRLEELLLVSAEFSDLGASAPAASAGIGGLVLFGQPPASAGPTIKAGLDALTRDAAATGRVAPWFATDEEGGTVSRLANVIGTLPTARRMAAQWTTAQVQFAAAEHGAAMRALGVNVDLAPVLDAAPSADAVADEADRSFSGDPVTAGAYGTAFAAGLQAAGVVAVAKHFPGLGHATANTDVAAATGPTLDALEAADLVPFEASIAAGVPAVMVSHMAVPGLTGGQPASLSPAVYALLRDRLGFDGVAMTDSLGAGAISAAGDSEPAAAVVAIEAGADMAMIDASARWATIGALEHAVATGTLPLSRVDEAVARVLAAKHACT